MGGVPDGIAYVGPGRRVAATSCLNSAGAGWPTGCPAPRSSRLGNPRCSPSSPHGVKARAYTTRAAARVAPGGSRPVALLARSTAVNGQARLSGSSGHPATAETVPPATSRSFRGWRPRDPSVQSLRALKTRSRVPGHRTRGRCGPPSTPGFPDSERTRASTMVLQYSYESLSRSPWNT